MHRLNQNVCLATILGICAGVQKPVICDLYLMKVTVTTTAKPDVVLKTVQKVKKDAEIWPQQKK